MSTCVTCPQQQSWKRPWMRQLEESALVQCADMIDRSTVLSILTITKGRSSCRFCRPVAAHEHTSRCTTFLCDAEEEAWKEESVKESFGRVNGPGVRQFTSVTVRDDEPEGRTRTLKVSFARELQFFNTFVPCAINELLPPYLSWCFELV